MQLFLSALLISAGIAGLAYSVASGSKKNGSITRWLADLHNHLPLSKPKQHYTAVIDRADLAGWPDFNKLLLLSEILAIALFLLLWCCGCSIAISILPAFAVFAAVYMKLRETVKIREQKIREDFAPTIELMAMTVGAGMDIVSSMRVVCGKLSASPLTAELERIALDLQLGQSKESAFMKFQERNTLSESKELVASILQSEKSGSPLARALQGLSIRLRTERLQTAEKAAFEAPVKLLGPLALFIFPVVFIVLFGPIILKFMAKD